MKHIFLLVAIILLISCSDDESSSSTIPAPTPVVPGLLTSIQLQDGKFGSKFDISAGATPTQTITINNAPTTIQSIRNNLAIYFTKSSPSVSVNYNGTALTSGATVSFENSSIELVVSDSATPVVYKIGLSVYDENMNPYGIYTAEHLSDMRNSLSTDGASHIVGSFKMMNNITLPAVEATEPCQAEAVKLVITDYCTAGWLPIADKPVIATDGSITSGAFIGRIDGQGFSINDLYINRSNSQFGALIGAISNPVVARKEKQKPKQADSDADILKLGVNVKDISITTAATNVYLGGIAGYNYSGVIIKSFTTGVIKSTGTTTNTYAGGIVGFNHEIGSIERSYSTTSISASSSANSYSGGITGQNFGLISNSYTTGGVFASGSTSSYSGGLSGSNQTGWATIEDSYATGDVSGASGTTAYVGAILGRNSSGSLDDVYRNSDAIITKNNTACSGTTYTCDDAGLRDITPMTLANMKTQAFTNTLNTNQTSPPWGWNSTINSSLPHLVGVNK